MSCQEGTSVSPLFCTYIVYTVCIIMGTNCIITGYKPGVINNMKKLLTKFLSFQLLINNTASSASHVSIRGTVQVCLRPLAVLPFSAFTDKRRLRAPPRSPSLPPTLPELAAAANPPTRASLSSNVSVFPSVPYITRHYVTAL